MSESKQSMLSALRLVSAGLKNGSIKSKPVISFDEESEQADMRSLEEIVDEAISKATS